MVYTLLVNIVPSCQIVYLGTPDAAHSCKAFAYLST